VSRWEADPESDKMGQRLQGESPGRHGAAVVGGTKEDLGRDAVVEGQQKDAMVIEESDDDEGTY